MGPALAGRSGVADLYGASIGHTLAISLIIAVPAGILVAMI